jgi:site-specific recombinase XerD
MPAFPTIVWPEGIDAEASDWLRTLVVDRSVLPSTAKEYAKITRPFLRFCRQQKRSWDSVDDDFLVAWRERMRRREGVDIPRINMSMRTIFAFYEWAEQTRRLRYHVGVYDRGDLPSDVADIQFRITARKSFSKGRTGRVFGCWRTPLTISSPRSGGGRHTPTDDEIVCLHEHVIEAEFGERNALFLSWMEDTGGRRKEILQIKTTDLPTMEQLERLMDTHGAWTIKIKRKGGAIGTLSAQADLLINTIDWVEHGRREIVAKMKRTMTGYAEPYEVFLSSTTGTVINADSVTSIGGAAFKRAGIKNASIHRLRARYCVRTIETLVTAMFGDKGPIGAQSPWVETILTMASEKMGHMSPASLRPYLNYLLGRRIRMADATEAESIDSRLRQLEHREQAMLKRLGDEKMLQCAAQCIRSGDEVEAARCLRVLLDKLESGRSEPLSP